MKKNLTLFLLLLSFRLMAQTNTITIDVSQQKLENPDIKLNFDQPILLRIDHAAAKEKAIVTCTFPVRAASDLSFNCDKTGTLEPKDDFPSENEKTNFDINFKFENSTLTFKIAVKKDGSISYVAGNAGNGGNVIADNDLFNNIHQTQADYINRYKNLVIYYPCDNIFKVYRNGKPKNAFWYTGPPMAGIGGAVLLIENFNTIKYTIAVTNSFIDNSNQIPSVFSDVSTMISTASQLQASGNQFDMIQVLTLDRNLKALLRHDCGDFHGATAAMDAYLDNYFKGDLKTSYDNYRIQMKTQNNPDVSPAALFTDKTLNDFLTKHYLLLITPDSLVKETLGLITAIHGASFTYQYNVVQLQNTDQVQFTLNITPNAKASGVIPSDGAINVVNQNLDIPVLGGWKFDFSTGFFYSTKKNLNYALRKNQTGDTTKSSIVEQNNFNGGTIGVNGLLHAYYRFADGFTPALSFGVGKSLDLNYALMGGVSALINVTGQNKIGISYGLTYNNIKGLSNSMQNDNGSYIPQPASVTAIAYANRFTWGRFFSLTYTFGLTKASQSTSSSAATPSTAAASATTTAAPSATPAGGASGATATMGHGH
jgi:hypothetical protein